MSRAIAKKKKASAVQQTAPPRVGLTKIYRNGIFPVGEEVEYQYESVRLNFLKSENEQGTDFSVDDLLSTTSRITSAEKRELERSTHADPETTYTSVRRAAEVHRQVRAYAQEHIKPGMTMTEIAEMIEDGTRALVEECGLESGVGFPTGLSVNEVAAHYTPNAGDKQG
jgi:methionyl aminopeptidase